MQVLDDLSAICSRKSINICNTSDVNCGHSPVGNIPKFVFLPGGVPIFSESGQIMGAKAALIKATEK